MADKSRQQRYTLTQAKQILFCDAKTLREWVTLLGIDPVRDTKDKRKWYISASDLEALRKHHAERAVVKGPKVIAQDETIRMLLERIAALEEEMARYRPALERYERLYGMAEREAPASNYVRPLRPPREPSAPKSDEPPADLPTGTMMGRRFAEDHGIIRSTFDSQVAAYAIRTGKSLYTNRPQGVGDRQNHWITPEQQSLAIAMWREKGQEMHECQRPGCPCHS